MIRRLFTHVRCAISGKRYPRAEMMWREGVGWVHWSGNDYFRWPDD